MMLKILMCFLSIVNKNMHHKLSNTMMKMEIQNEMGLQNEVMVQNDTIAKNETIIQNDTYRIERFLELIKNKKLYDEEEIRWDNGEVEW